MSSLTKPSSWRKVKTKQTNFPIYRENSAQFNKRTGNDFSARYRGMYMGSIHFAFFFLKFYIHQITLLIVPSKTYAFYSNQLRKQAAKIHMQHEYTMQ